MKNVMCSPVWLWILFQGQAKVLQSKKFHPTMRLVRLYCMYVCIVILVQMWINQDNQASKEPNTKSWNSAVLRVPISKRLKNCPEPKLSWLPHLVLALPHIQDTLRYQDTICKSSIKILLPSLGFRALVSKPLTSWEKICSILDDHPTQREQMDSSWAL